MTAIAAEGGRSPRHRLRRGGRKPELARLLIETAISGTSQAVAGRGTRLRPGHPRRRRRRDQDRHLRLGDAGHRRPPRPGLSIIQQAAPAEPELATLWTEIAVRRAANMRLFAADLAAAAPLRVDPGDAADIIWATNAPELYQLLVGQRGWSPERYEHFLADTWRRLLLAG